MRKVLSQQQFWYLFHGLSIFFWRPVLGYHFFAICLVSICRAYMATCYEWLERMALFMKVTLKQFRTTKLTIIATKFELIFLQTKIRDHFKCQNRTQNWKNNWNWRIFLHPYTISMIINVVLYGSTLLPASKKNVIMTPEIMCITSTPPFSVIKSDRRRQPWFVQTQELQEIKANVFTKATQDRGKSSTMRKDLRTGTFR